MTEDLRKGQRARAGGLKRLVPAQYGGPLEPAKRINDGEDLAFFLTSKAYADIMTFLLQLNRSMMPLRSGLESDGYPLFVAWPTDSGAINLSTPVEKMRKLVKTLVSMLDEAPPETGPRRFGNAAFRKWYKLVETRIPSLLQDALPESVWTHVKDDQGRTDLVNELGAYLLGSMGSSQRLDYGTGHELSFLAFLGCIWKLGGFASDRPGVEERGIVVGIVEPYIELVRTLIITYTLEPAGSHGVWGLDDHCFLPYIFGSAQFSSPVDLDSSVHDQGSLSTAPPPSQCVKETIARDYQKQNMYCSAVRFIYDVKTGPFWEHSPTLYDISGIKDGWSKVNKGLVKMYNAEVLSKFPVIQHFPFGSLFRWEMDPEARPPPTSVHASQQPKNQTANIAGPLSMGGQSMQAPWAKTSMPAPSVANTAAPWAQTQQADRNAARTGGLHTTMPTRTMALPGQRVPERPQSGVGADMPAPTGAPWAREGPT